MKLIQQSKLFYKEGNSDKVYEIDLCELSPESYIVNFRYGRRGSSLKEGTKTPESVSREKAGQIFSDLENEKISKGYQTEAEIFIELPVLDLIDPDTVKGAILHRLQDAIEGKNSFKTEWKTSRVIWKAGYLKIDEAVPYIIRLANKGDEMQTYAALWALSRMKVADARDLFKSFAFQSKRKSYSRNIAYEGLLNVLQGDERVQVIENLKTKLPPEIRYHMETDNPEALRSGLRQYSDQKQVDFFTDLYLLSKDNASLQSAIQQTIKEWPLSPPYFRHIRAIYKLAQARNDSMVLATLFYRFEKEHAMFNRRVPLDARYKRYLTSIDQMVCIGDELKSNESKIAYSNYTKEYFRNNSVGYLKDMGKDAGAREYLKLAVSTLLQYTSADYTAAGKRPLSYYGSYNYQKKDYSFTLVDYPECSGSFLLSTILFGNDPERLLQSNKQYIYGREVVKSNHYYYDPYRITGREGKPAAGPQKEAPAAQDTPSGSGKSSLISVFKSIFGKKQPEAAPVEPAKEEEPVSEPVTAPVVKNTRKELFPEHWDAFPEAYIQLLMQADMDLIHRFAYQNLSERNDFYDICNRFDGQAILKLLNRNYDIPNRLGFETMTRRASEFIQDITFVARVLDTNSEEARNWVKREIDKNTDHYIRDLDFMVFLLFNTKEDNEQWIDALLKKSYFTDDRLKAILGKVVAELLHFGNTGENNDLAKTAIRRMNMIAQRQMEQIGWNVVEQLLSSPLLANTLFASHILISKSEKVQPSDIPATLTDSFLRNEIPEVRQNGIRLLNQYPADFLVKNNNFLFSHVNSDYPDVLESVLDRLRALIPGNASMGNDAVSHLIYALIRKEKFEGSHTMINAFVRNELKPFWNTGLKPKELSKAIYAQYRETQLTGYEILKGYDHTNDFTLGQIIAFGGHEILAIRQWCWNYYKQNVGRIRYERDKALGLLDSKWDDTRTYAFHFFRTEFSEKDWDTDTLISIVDSVRPDVETFGKELIMTFFKPENGPEYLTKLSEHPSVNIQLFVTNYLSLYIGDHTDKLKGLDFYFRSVLTRVNKARVAKDRIFGFLHQEALKDEERAAFVSSVLDDVSAQSTVQDKATCIRILTEIKRHYAHLDMHLTIKN